MIQKTFVMGEETCSQGEYKTGTLCCPMCQPATKVYRHCTEMSSTTCIPCVEGTYMDHPNGLTECFKCKFCDRGMGLSEKQSCTYFKNTVCGCQSGFFCAELKRDDCDLCQRQSVCEPGYYLKKPGTETTDTVCETCPDGTFSTENMSEKCKPWTKCTDLNMDELKSGTPSSDSLCKKKNIIVPIALGIIISLLLLISGLCVLYCKRKRKLCFGPDSCFNKNSPREMHEKVEGHPLNPVNMEGQGRSVIVNMKRTVNSSLAKDNDSGMHSSGTDCDFIAPVEETGR
nr:tumor necrosis factor receptor superfamily member 14 isoform X2 [Geotrypetes seraphini]